MFKIYSFINRKRYKRGCAADMQPGSFKERNARISSGFSLINIRKQTKTKFLGKYIENVNKKSSNIVARDTTNFYNTGSEEDFI